jgi:LuxR family transcriptional regulator, maltose regulon positive regulatory protein
VQAKGRGATVGVADSVIPTKFYLPTSRHPVVPRPRLEEQLSRALGVPLTVVGAPAGWGKSTLVADWLRRAAPAAGWVSLDDNDNDPYRFWRYLLGALAQARPGLGVEALRALEAPRTDLVTHLLPALVADLVALPDDVVLVLDDYHLITNADVHHSLQSLLVHCPTQLHVILLTRIDPPLPLGRLRVRGDLLEIRASQLRFTAGEATAFLHDLRLPPNDVERLLARTEGWAAGLQLAALRLRDRPDPTDFIDRFIGADRHVIDYLAEEVLDTQPPRVREFLLKTSVLERFCVPLCNALTGGQDGAELIEEIARADLFVIHLDEERHWFRYHHLFGQLLRHELTRTDVGIGQLHERAARWLSAAGDSSAAIRHAFECADLSLAGDLVAAGWQAVFNAGQMATVRAWLDRLPDELVAEDPRLSVARVWIELDSGRLEDVARALDAAEAAGRTDAHLHVLRAVHRFKTGDVSAAAELLAQLGPAPDDLFMLTVHRLVSGVSAFWLGNFDRAHHQLSQAGRHAEDDGNALASIYAVGCLAFLSALRGDRVHAEDLLRDAESAVERTLSHAHFVAMYPALTRATLEASRGNWKQAHESALAAVSRSRRGAGHVEVAAALLTLANVTRRQAADSGAARSNADDAGGPAAQTASLSEIRTILRQCPAHGPLVGSWLDREQRPDDQHPPSAVEPLTERELAILRLLPDPLSQRELAAALFVTPNTLKTHLRAIYRKLAVDSRSRAVLRAREEGLL